MRSMPMASTVGGTVLGVKTAQTRALPLRMGTYKGRGKEGGGGEGGGV